MDALERIWAALPTDRVYRKNVLLRLMLQLICEEDPRLRPALVKLIVACVSTATEDLKKEKPMHEIVRFHSPDEFLQELETSKRDLDRGRASVERGLVRITNRFRSDPVLPINRRFVVATAVISAETDHGLVRSLLCLETYLGQQEATGEISTDTPQRAEALVKKLEATCSALGLEVRAGVIEAPPSGGLRG